MIHEHATIERIVPWVVSGASGLYVVVRTRSLSRAKASSDPLLYFLLNQVDLLLMLCGSPVIWYAANRRRQRNGQLMTEAHLSPEQMHRMRQVFSALLLGIGMLERRLRRNNTTEMAALVQRLHTIVREGIGLLRASETPSAPAALAAENSRYPASI